MVENMLENRIQTETKRFGTMDVPVIEYLLTRSLLKKSPKKLNHSYFR